MFWLCGEKKAQDTVSVSPELCVSVCMHVFRDLFSICCLSHKFTLTDKILQTCRLKHAMQTKRWRDSLWQSDPTLALVKDPTLDLMKGEGRTEHKRYTQSTKTELSFKIRCFRLF